MSEIRHHPWIGPRFQQSHRRLLLLGESHHGSDPGAVDLTALVVERWLSGVSNPALSFFTRLAIALSGKEPGQLDRKDVFANVAFYNYVQAVMAASRTSPTALDFDSAEASFRQVIEDLQPTHIIVCGYRLWDRLPYFDPPNSKGDHMTLADKNFHLGRYRSANASPITMCIQHPQSGFNGREWYPRIKSFLEQK